METREQQSKEHRAPSLLSTNFCAEINEKSRQLLTVYNPDSQITLCQDEAECFFGEHPTLARINRENRPATAQALIVAHLLDLSEYCGCREKITDRQLRQCAELITSEYYYMKVTELLLFFKRFKCGNYGLFYGAIDPITIMAALRKFAAERQDAHARHENEENRLRLIEESKCAMSWADYSKCNGIEGESPANELAHRMGVK